MFAACRFQHSWRGLAGLNPLAFSEAVRKLREQLAANLRGEGEGGEGDRPPTMGGGGWVATGVQVCKGGVEGVLEDFVFCQRG